MPYYEVTEDGVVLTPDRLRRLATRSDYEAYMATVTHASDSEALSRQALHMLIDAFLSDRQANADLFSRAHRLGREVMTNFTCPLIFDADDESYRSDCPVHQLHAVVATSIGWTWTCRCSICDAEPFTCDHMPGEMYDDNECYYAPFNAPVIDHVALTADPDFAYTWIADTRQPASELVSHGAIKKAGDCAYCTHCDSCYGLWGASAGNLDPVTRWKDFTESRA